MPKEKADLQKHTLNFYRGDLERLQAYYPELGASVVVRKIVRQYLNKIDKAAEGEAPDIQVKL